MLCEFFVCFGYQHLAGHVICKHLLPFSRWPFWGFLIVSFAMKKAFHLISPFFIFVLFPLPETYLKKKTTISMSDVRKFNCLCNPLEVSCYQILRLYLYNLFEFIFVHGVTEHVQLLSHVRLRNSMGCRLSEIFLARIWKSVAISSFKGYSWFDPWVSCTGR